jgi:hypothetical protein
MQEVLIIKIAYNRQVLDQAKRNKTIAPLIFFVQKLDSILHPVFHHAQYLQLSHTSILTSHFPLALAEGCNPSTQDFSPES